MAISEELARLAELHRKGDLTDAEYELAKAAVLNTASSSSPTRSPVPQFVAPAPRFLSFHVVTAGIGLLLAILFFFIFFLPNWREADRQQTQFENELRDQQELRQQQWNSRSPVLKQ